jgi:transcriptional regulator with XRE-family HTH domain
LDLDDLGQRLREARRALKLTQVELGARAHVSRQTIDRLENSRTPEIGYRSLLRLLHVVGLDLRLTAYNQSRPTLEDLAHENEEAEAKARAGTEARARKDARRRPS